MNLHTGEECQKIWRDAFSEQLENALEAFWPEETDTDIDRAKWFREGIRYAMMIVRWDYLEE